MGKGEGITVGLEGGWDVVLEVVRAEREAKSCWRKKSSIPMTEHKKTKVHTNGWPELPSHARQYLS